MANNKTTVYRAYISGFSHVGSLSEVQAWWDQLKNDSLAGETLTIHKGALSGSLKNSDHSVVYTGDAVFTETFHG